MDNSDCRILLICHQVAAARKPTLQSDSAPPPFKVAYFSLWLVPLLYSCVSWLLHVTSKSSNEEKEKFQLARVEWLPVTSRSYVTHSLTDNCKISKDYMHKRKYSDHQI